MDAVLALANNPVMWLFAVIIISVVLVQSYLFMSLALKFSNKHKILTPNEKTTIFKTATINSIGPSIAVFFLAISLIAAIGAPMTMMRVGVIGSAYFEQYASLQGKDVVMAAHAASGVEDPNILFKSYTAAVWAMTMGGMGWLISALFFTRKLDKARHTMAKKNPRMLLAIAAISPSAIFVVLIANSFYNHPKFESVVSMPHLSAALSAGISMGFFLLLSKKYPWLKEWALGFSFILGILGGWLAG